MPAAGNGEEMLDCAGARTARAGMGLLLPCRVIRFISLHEVDAWNAAMPWARVVVELMAAAGASAVAIARLLQLAELAQLWQLK